MRYFILLFVLLLSFDTHAAKYISLEEIEKQLPNHPINVGVDLYDTLVEPTNIFSAPKYYEHIQELYDLHNFPDDIKFTRDLSIKYARYANIKNMGRRIMKMHAKRGDNIYVITAGMYYDGEEITELLYKAFPYAKDNIKRVIFSGYFDTFGIYQVRKQQDMKGLKLTMYYADSDSDMRVSMKNGVRPIRMLRSPVYCCYRGKARPGVYSKEEILIDSDR